MNTPVIKDAVSILHSEHLEWDVERAMFAILRRCFPLEQNWSLVPEFFLPEKNRPDILVEKYIGPNPSRKEGDLFKPNSFFWAEEWTWFKFGGGSATSQIKHGDIGRRAERYWYLYLPCCCQGKIYRIFWVPQLQECALWGWYK